MQDREAGRGSEPAPSIKDTLRERIAAEGPITLEAYMAAANAHYYATRDPLGIAGDFVTAPEISQMFGEIIGAWTADLWDRAGRPEAAYVELGPGRGTLAADALRVMRRAGFDPPVHLIETSPAFRAMQAARLPEATWHEGVATLPDDRALLVIANEFFDALAVRQLVRVETGWRERMVEWGGRFVSCLGVRDVSSEVPARWRGEPPGIVVELRPAAADIVGRLGARIAAQGGALLAIDYGHKRSAPGDTLQAVRRHAAADPFADPGEADLTAHLDFQALAAAAPMLAASRVVDQGEWLIGLGIAHRAAALARAADPARQEEIAIAYRRLTDRAEMGALFKVVALTARGWPPPAGL